MKKIILLSILALSFLISCDDAASGGTGSVQFYVEPEWTIVNGISTGDGEEDMRDGWSVEYERFLVSLGNITVSKSTSSTVYKDENTYVIDLKGAPTAGLLVTEFNDLDNGDWDRVGYQMPQATEGALTLQNDISDEDYNSMVDNELSVSVRMVLNNSSGQVCPYLIDEDEPAATDRPCFDTTEIVLDWELPYGVEVNGCMTESQIGINIPSGGTTQAKLTIHADHHFFTAIRHTDVMRIAQPIIDADLDLDGYVTLDELESVPATVLDPTVYDLSTFPGDVETLGDYVYWTTITFPHYQGDGGCPEKNPL
ncbi:MAG: hypothetical protein JXR95_06780 [Deltaproteobacteria bacterium]|nr:hypothetical protein [Deltaproteobacteria bacterium]